MKTRLVTIILGLGTLAASTMLPGAEAFYDKAKVVDVVPLYETVRVAQPERQCTEEIVPSRRWGRREHSYTPLVAGAIVGGVVGNQFGRGRGKDAMTVAGALLGASVGNDIGKSHGHRRNRKPGRVQQHCEWVDRYVEQEELAGYGVTYRYRGRLFQTRMATHPGKRIEVEVQLEPTEKQASSNYQEPVRE
ncbi:MAG: glycine zipper 2TM domain-containing protein [Gammaproteobacteria bacterium]|nr:glycine zipper 2TM domain-containing protein [Gammaproteobacteria bacterium]